MVASRPTEPPIDPEVLEFQSLWPDSKILPRQTLDVVDSAVGRVAVLTGTDTFDDGPVRTVEPRCLALMGPLPSGDVPTSHPAGCGYADASGGNPVAATISWVNQDQGVSWAALVPEGWTELVIADGDVTPVVDNVVAIPDITGRPLTALLHNADGRSVTVAVLPWSGP